MFAEAMHFASCSPTAMETLKNLISNFVEDYNFY
jgi:hypothetical protein